MFDQMGWAMDLTRANEWSARQHAALNFCEPDRLYRESSRITRVLHPQEKRSTLHAQTKVLDTVIPFSPISKNACQTSGMAIPLTLNWRHLYKM